MNAARLILLSAGLCIAMSSSAAARLADYFIGVWECRGGTGPSRYVVQLRYKTGGRFSFDYAARINREPIAIFGTGTWSTDRGRTITETIKSFNIDASKAVDLDERPPSRQAEFRRDMASLSSQFKREGPSTDRVRSASRNQFRRVDTTDATDRMTCRRQRP